jgi:hypothetical protein
MPGAKSRACGFLWVGLVGVLACASVDPAAPLGSVANPVRAHTFLGEIEYLSRLRCPDGTRPHVQRYSSRRKGPYGNMLLAYRVRCIYLNQEQKVFVDSFHPDYAERQPVPGFTTANGPDPRQLFWMKIP